MIVIAIIFSGIVKACLRRARPERHKRMEINTSTKRKGEKISFSSNDKRKEGWNGIFHTRSPRWPTSLTKRSQARSFRGARWSRDKSKVYKNRVTRLPPRKYRRFTHKLFEISQALFCEWGNVRLIAASDHRYGIRKLNFLRKAFAHFPWAK